MFDAPKQAVAPSEFSPELLDLLQRTHGAERVKELVKLKATTPEKLPTDDELMLQGLRIDYERKSRAGTLRSKGAPHEPGEGSRLSRTFSPELLEFLQATFDAERVKALVELKATAPEMLSPDHLILQGGLRLREDFGIPIAGPGEPLRPQA